MPSLHHYSGSVPANYDQYLGPYLFEPYAIDLVQRLAKDNCRIVLELACGTGRVTNHLIKIIPRDGELFATDINEDMLQVAQAKVVDKRIRWKALDAQQLPFEKEVFDHVVCQFGVMFFPNKKDAFAEVYRVLQPRGKFIFNTWGRVEHNKHSAFIQQLIHDVFKDEAPDFLGKGPYSFCDKEAIKQTLEAAGFKNIQICEVNKTACYPNIDEYLAGFLDGSPLSAFIAKQPQGTRELLKHHATKQLSQKATPAIQASMLAYVCIGEKGSNPGDVVG